MLYGGNGHFVNEIFTYKPQANGIESNSPDPTNERYVQAAFFDSYSHLDPPPNPPERYFMIVNRRCSPFIDNSSSDNIGGKRLIKMSIHPFSLWFKKYRNISLQDLSDNSIDTTFYNEDNINYDLTLNLGWFNPGEAKLFKLSPTVCVGGSLVADEWLSTNENLTCDGKVNTNGKVLMIGDSTTISFTSTGEFYADGGSFGCYSETPSVTFKGSNGQNWTGLKLNNCYNAIRNSKFENTSGHSIIATNTSLYVENCKFNVNSGAIQLTNFSSLLGNTVQILNCTFNVSNSNATVCNLIGEAGTVLDIYLEKNEFTTNSPGAAVFANSCTGVIKNSIINNFRYGIFTTGSVLDLYNNVINTAAVNSNSVDAVAMSGLNLGINGYGYLTGGKNNITNSGSNSNNLYVDNSTFNVHRGNNIFNINPSANYHINGTFPSFASRDYPSVYARQNCFKISDINDAARSNVYWLNSNNTPVTFLLIPYSCVNIDPAEEDELIATLEHGVLDTIKKTDEFVSEESGTGARLYDSLCLSVRMKNFEIAANTCKTFITEFADSVELKDKTLDAVSKLFYSTQEIDTNIFQMENLKTYFENIILNHPENTDLAMKVFNYIQKCKVVLEDYQTAMNGFQQIIDQNPYSYEALAASWDYDATYLLESQTGGSGGAISNYKLQIANDESVKKYLNDDPNEKYDKKVFTKNDRKTIKENVYNSFETKRIKEINIVKALEKKVSEGKANDKEKKELELKNVLNETAKPKRPQNISDLLNNVNNDINKITETGEDNSVSKILNALPDKFFLSQNYPNPFNPVTNLEFGVSNLGFVSLKIYDVLGREVKTLVNEIKPAGIYKLEFDGSNFASGVYFYILEAGDFVQTKRLVLIK